MSETEYLENQPVFGQGMLSIAKEAAVRHGQLKTRFTLKRNAKLYAKLPDIPENQHVFPQKPPVAVMSTQKVADFSPNPVAVEASKRFSKKNKERLLILGELPSNAKIVASEILDASGARNPNYHHVAVYVDDKNKIEGMPETGHGVEVIYEGFVSSNHLKAEDSLQKTDQVIFPHAPTKNDIVQSSDLGDCFLLATLQGILELPFGQDFLVNMLQQQKNQHVLVRYYHPETKEPIYIKSDAVYYNKEKVKHKAFWVHMLETTYAGLGYKINKDKKNAHLKFERVIPSLNTMYGKGGNVGFAMEMLTGETAIMHNLRNKIDEVLPWDQAVMEKAKEVYLMLPEDVRPENLNAQQKLGEFYKNVFDDFQRASKAASLSMLDQNETVEEAEYDYEYRIQRYTEFTDIVNDKRKISELTKNEAEKIIAKIAELYPEYFSKELVEYFYGKINHQTTHNGISYTKFAESHEFSAYRQAEIEVLLDIKNKLGSHILVAGTHEENTLIDDFSLNAFKSLDREAVQNRLKALSRNSFCLFKQDEQFFVGGYAADGTIAIKLLVGLETWPDLNNKSEKRKLICEIAKLLDREVKFPNGLYPTHAYTIMGVSEEQVQGRTLHYIKLRNPWGRTGIQYQWGNDFSRNQFADKVTAKTNDAEFKVELSHFLKFFHHYTSCYDKRMVFGQSAQYSLVTKTYQSSEIFSMQKILAEIRNGKQTVSKKTELILCLLVNELTSHLLQLSKLQLVPKTKSSLDSLSKKLEAKQFSSKKAMEELLAEVHTLSEAINSEDSAHDTTLIYYYCNQLNQHIDGVMQTISLDTSQQPFAFDLHGGEPEVRKIYREVLTKSAQLAVEQGWDWQQFTAEMFSDKQKIYREKLAVNFANLPLAEQAFAQLINPDFYLGNEATFNKTLHEVLFHDLSDIPLPEVVENNAQSYQHYLNMDQPEAVRVIFYQTLRASANLAEAKNWSFEDFQRELNNKQFTQLVIKQTENILGKLTEKGQDLQGFNQSLIISAIDILRQQNGQYQKENDELFAAAVQAEHFTHREEVQAKNRPSWIKEKISIIRNRPKSSAAIAGAAILGSVTMPHVVLGGALYHLAVIAGAKISFASTLSGLSVAGYLRKKREQDNQNKPSKFNFSSLFSRRKLIGQSLENTTEVDNNNLIKPK